MLNIETTKSFIRKFKKLPANIKKKAIKREQIFKDNPFDSRLETHKLHGKLKEEFSYSIDKTYRIRFIFVSKNTVLYTSTGTHDEVY